MSKLDVLKKGVVALAVVAMGSFATPVFAALDNCTGTGCVGDGADATGINDDRDLTAIVSNIINVILYVIGILAVAFIIYGGVKYAMSAGDSAKVKSAKDTIMYAVIGLIVAILAYAIVNFVITAL